MPVLKSRLRAVSDNLTLVLRTQHGLSMDSIHLEPCSKILARLPAEIEVYAAHTITITLAGTVNNIAVQADEIASSQLAKSLHDYFEMNAETLGLDSVGHFYPDENRHIISMQLTPQFAARNPRTELPRLRLHTIDLVCSWTSDGEYQPFSRNSPLSIVTLFNEVLSRTAKWHLYRRYPLIFGAKCKQLSLETPFFQAIFRSLVSIKDQSPNNDFRQPFDRLLEKVNEGSTRIFDAAAEALSDYGDHALSPPEDEAAFAVVTERIYQKGLQQKRYKDTYGVSQAKDQDDEEMMESSQSQEPAESLDLGDTLDDEILFTNLPTNDDRPQVELWEGIDPIYGFGFGEDELHDFGSPPNDAHESSQLLDTDDDGEDDLDITDEACESSPWMSEADFRIPSPVYIGEFSDEESDNPFTPSSDEPNEAKIWLELENDLRCIDDGSCEIGLDSDLRNFDADFIHDDDWEEIENSSDSLLHTLSYSYDSEMLLDC
ncbi:hypothetical protein BKA70DRAFT_859348 [Coprinopsis sp. MPI-PUGE-AT-0042]|nr:hypothetical protein BKA70DRAFT_859348 [Coprinopsis sp. MPI-PUGE-AT-0042]